MTEAPEAVKKMRFDIERAKNGDDPFSHHQDRDFAEDIISHIVALAERLKTAEETLEFYSDKETYHSKIITQLCECCTDIIAAPIEEDEGQRARDWMEGK